MGESGLILGRLSRRELLGVVTGCFTGESVKVTSE